MSTRTRANLIQATLLALLIGLGGCGDLINSIKSAVDGVSKGLSDAFGALGSAATEAASRSPREGSRLPALPAEATGGRDLSRPASGRQGSGPHDMDGDGAEETVTIFVDDSGTTYLSWALDETCFFSFETDAYYLLIWAPCDGSDGAMTCEVIGEDLEHCLLCNDDGDCTTLDYDDWDGDEYDWPEDDVCGADGECDALCIGDPDCGEVCEWDGYCEEGCDDDPDCDDECGEDGDCDLSCYTDPDCNEECDGDGICNVLCDDDPDCDCLENGFCDELCDFDPDCDEEECGEDGYCDELCDFDPDCDEEECGEDGYCDEYCDFDPDC